MQFSRMELITFSALYKYMEQSLASIRMLKHFKAIEPNEGPLFLDNFSNIIPNLQHFCNRK